MFAAQPPDHAPLGLAGNGEDDGERHELRVEAPSAGGQHEREDEQREGERSSSVGDETQGNKTPSGAGAPIDSRFVVPAGVRCYDPV